MGEVDFCYLIGALLGDGCLYVGKNNYQFSITSEDYDFCQNCQNIVKKNFGKKGNIKTVRKHNKISYFQLVVCSKNIVYYLKELTNNKEIIPSFIYESPDLIKGFVQGLMDSDGWISRINASDGYIRYRIGFKNISEWTKDFKEMFGIFNVRTGKLRFCSDPRSNISAQVFSINSFDYCSKIGFRIKRKYKLQEDFLSWHKRKQVNCV